MKKEVTTLLLLILLTVHVQAIGIAVPYWDERPLELYPGEETTVNLNVQNGVGNKEYIFTVEITNDGKGIATIENKKKSVFVTYLTKESTVYSHISKNEDPREEATTNIQGMS